MKEFKKYFDKKVNESNTITDLNEVPEVKEKYPISYVFTRNMVDNIDFLKHFRVLERLVDGDDSDLYKIENSLIWFEERLGEFVVNYKKFVK